MIQFEHVFISPYELQFLFAFQKNLSQKYIFESFRWCIIPLDFVVFFLGLPN
jgi:hypothetical protein